MANGVEIAKSTRRDFLRKGILGTAGLFLAGSQQASAEFFPLNCFNPESPILGDVVGKAVRVPARLPVPVRDFHPFPPENEYFNPIYDKATANARNRWKGIGPHYPIAISNVDSSAVFLTTSSINLQAPTAKVGELTVKGLNGGRVGVSFYQEQNHQFEGAFGEDAPGHLVNRLNWNMAYYFEGFNPEQEVKIADPDTGRLMHYRDGKPAVFNADSEGKIAFNAPRACGDVRFQVVFNILANPGFNTQEVKIRRGPDDRPGLGITKPLPPGVVKPGAPEDNF